MNDTQERMEAGEELAKRLTKCQADRVSAAMERVRMGKSGWYHELATLVLHNCPPSLVSDSIELPDTAFLLDATGREIMQGDVVKVLHYHTRCGRGYRKHWMYKWVKDVHLLGASHMPALRMAHLERSTEDGYWELLDGRQLEHVWIIQGFGPKGPDGYGIPFEKRPKRQPCTPTT